MFGRKSKFDLRMEILKLQLERDRLKLDVNLLERKVEEFIAIDKSMPDDCKRGEWCKTCTFNKFVTFPPEANSSICRIVHYCAKGMSCKHFVAKGEEKND